MIVKTTFIPKGFDAFTGWPVIFVRPEKASDTGLIAHEMVHYKEQAWVTLLWWALYLLSKSFRKNAELRAYKKQIAVGGISVYDAAQLLLQYRLGLTLAQACAALKEGTGHV